MTFLPVDEQLAIIKRGIEKIVPEEELANRLKWSRDNNTPLRVKYGIDPTGIDLHLGHTVPMRKMRQFQELGHQPVIIIGNYTALVGDPSGRDETRARLTQEQVEANAEDYLQQVGKVIDLSQAEVVRNGDWFAPMTFSEILELCSSTTVAQLLTRDDFSKRFKTESPIFLHECLYPIMQAFDSVVIGADIELGGTEQLYSFMLARDLQKNQQTCRLAERFMNETVKQRLAKTNSLPPQISVMSPILVGLDGIRRMGKSLGNYIGISEAPYEMMKKFMQLPDDCMAMFFELLTDLPLEQVETVLAGHPKEAKLTLAQTVIGEYHNDELATAAGKRWQQEISQKSLPADIPELFPEQLKDGFTFPTTDEHGHPQAPVMELLVAIGFCQSKSEARKLAPQGGIACGEDRRPVTDPFEPISIPPEGTLLWRGRKKVARVHAGKSAT